MTETTMDLTSAAPRAARSKRPIFFGVAATILLIGVAYWNHARKFEDTDDAAIDSDISNVSPRVSGNIVAVNVVDNQAVKTGDVLAALDTRDLEVSVALAKAQVAQADAQLRVEDPSVSITESSNVASLSSSSSDLLAAQASVSQARKAAAQSAAQLAQVQANDINVQDERHRAEELIASGAISKSNLDQHISAAAASSANVEAARQATQAASDMVREAEAHLVAMHSRLAEVTSNAPRQIETRKASVVYRQAQLDAAKAQLDQAELNLSYAKVLAPVDGIIGKKSLSIGDHVAPGQQLMAIARTDQVWVTANFRETQLHGLHPGLSAAVHVDALDLDLRGTVESIGGATGSRFSVLPPENASGNYVKVVQRIPVRIRLDPGQAGVDLLRPGMSVEPQVRLE